MRRPVIAIRVTDEARRALDALISVDPRGSGIAPRILLEDFS